MALGMIKKKAIQLFFNCVAFIYSRMPELWQQKLKNKLSRAACNKLRDVTQSKAMDNLLKMQSRLAELNQMEAEQFSGAQDPGYTGPDAGQDPGQDLDREAELIQKMMNSAEFAGMIENTERIFTNPVVRRYPKTGPVIDENIGVHAKMTAQYIQMKTGGKMDFEKAYLGYTGVLITTILGVIAEDKIKERKAAARAKDTGGNDGKDL